MSSDDEDVYMEDDSDQKDDDKLEFLDSEDLEEDMKMAIESVKIVLQVSSGVCRLLLQKYKWSKESLLDRFYENQDTVSFLIDAHLLPGRSVAGCDQSSTECQICCTEGELSGLACNHLACKDCWNAYITDKIKEKHSEIECMASDCKLLIEDERVINYLEDPSIYQKVLVNSYVATNKSLRWCPGSCGKAVKVRSLADASIIICSCGVCFCFSCGHEGHDPINCRLLKLWMKKCQEDNQTFNWINVNTKDCPKCSSPIEKNGGCNYMRCHACKYEFCWLCFGYWKDEGAHSCNKFNETDNSSKRETCRISLEKYLFYYNRYLAHHRSLNLEQKLKDIVTTKMDHMQDLSMSWVEVQFLQKAFEVLSECRRTLMYTYAFAFFLKRDNNVMIFEANQADLERSTEQLSGLLERDLDHDDLIGMKQAVQDKFRYVEQRQKVLLDHCAEGKDLDIWKFNDGN
uniref:RBR-type E3 ubiquitin transferase n=1 Tax=Caenorhabditis tropicalis TaxID=1561998 RepID=A0A1I7U960_9PELO